MKRLALCIGNDEYKIMTPLSCACADAKAVSEKLEALGFETMYYENLDREAFVSAITEFDDAIENYDAVVFYYAGHGFQIDGKNILAPIDLNTNDKSDKEIRMNAFPLSDLTELLNRHSEIPKVIILDACRTDLEARGGSITCFGPVFASPGSIIAFSTSPGQASKENTVSGHGKYTETLLEFMELPRVPIETVFKKTRERLALKTENQQISWEHTSLIGDFYLNPDSVYDGTAYNEEAVCDVLFRFQDEGNQIKGIVDGLKSQVWDIQTQAIGKIYSADFKTSSADELFVLGRNICQAAEGNSYAAINFIDNFRFKTKIIPQAKKHILCGMAYEIYFDSHNRLRIKYKTKKYTTIVELLECNEFYACRKFIAAQLSKTDQCPIYIPGQTGLMYINVQTYVEAGHMYVRDIFYNGQSVYFSSEGSRKPDLEDMREISIDIFEDYIAKKLLAPKSSVRVAYIDEKPNAVLCIPSSGFSLRYVPIEEDSYELNY